MIARDGAFSPSEWIVGEYLTKPESPVMPHIAGLERFAPYGLHDGVSVIMAEPGAGKSALALHMALWCSLSDRVKTAVVSLEMAASDCYVRMASEYSAMGVDATLRLFRWSDAQRMRRDTWGLIESGETDEVRVAKGGVDALVDSVRSLERATSDTLIVTDETRLHDIDALVARIDEYADAGVRLVVVDYLQLIEAREADGMYEAVTTAMHRLKDVGHRRRVVILLVCSMSREGVKSNNMHGGAGSSAIEYDAEMVIRISASEDVRFKDEEAYARAGNPSRAVAVSVGKNRHGEVTTGDDADVMRFWPRTNYFAAPPAS